MDSSQAEGIRLSSRMPAWVTLKLVPGVVIVACVGLAVYAMLLSEWRGALLLLGFLAVLSVLTFGLVRYPAAARVIDKGDCVRIEARRWSGDIPLADIESVSFRPALNGRVVTLYLKSDSAAVPAWVFVPRLVLRAGMPREVEDLQQRVQRRHAMARSALKTESV
jgi:hypothetical protein